jgi:hypothetical protein
MIDNKYRTFTIRLNELGNVAAVPKRRSWTGMPLGRKQSNKVERGLFGGGRAPCAR